MQLAAGLWQQWDVLVAVLSKQLGELFPEDQDPPCTCGPRLWGLRASSTPPGVSPGRTTDIPAHLGASGQGCRGLRGGRCSPVGSAARWLMLGVTLSVRCQGPALLAAYLAAPPCETTLCEYHPSPFQIFW